MLDREMWTTEFGKFHQLYDALSGLRIWYTGPTGFAIGMLLNAVARFIKSGIGMVSHQGIPITGPPSGMLKRSAGMNPPPPFGHSLK